MIFNQNEDVGPQAIGRGLEVEVDGRDQMQVLGLVAKQERSTERAHICLWRVDRYILPRARDGAPSCGAPSSDPTEAA